MRSGKIDRGHLGRPVEDRLTSGRVEPASETERVVQEVWSEVLEVDALAVDENFFDIGGHSLLATQIVARLEGKLGIDLPLVLVFENPTVEDLAAAIGCLEPSQRARRPKLEPVPRDGSVDLFATTVALPRDDR